MTESAGKFTEYGYSYEEIIGGDYPMSDDRNKKLNGMDGFLGGFEGNDNSGGQQKGQYSYRGYSGYGSSLSSGRKQSEDPINDNNGYGGYSGSTPCPTDSFGGGYSGAFQQAAGSFSQTGADNQGGFGAQGSSDEYVPVRGTYDTFNSGHNGYQPIRGNAADSFMDEGSTDSPAARKKAGFKALVVAIVAMAFLLSSMLPILIPTIKNYFAFQKEKDRYQAVEAVYSDVIKVSTGVDANNKPKFEYVAYVDYTFNGTRYNDKNVKVSSEGVKGNNITIYVDKESPEEFYTSLPESAKRGQDLFPILIMIGFILICFLCMMSGVYNTYKGKSRRKGRTYTNRNSVGYSRSSASSGQSGSVNGTGYQQNTYQTASYGGSSPAFGSSGASSVWDTEFGNQQGAYRTSSSRRNSGSGGYVLFMVVGFIFAAIGYVGLIFNIVSNIQNSNLVKNGIEIEATCTYVYSNVDGGQLTVNGKRVNYMVDAKYEYEGKAYTKSRLVVYEQVKMGEKFFVYILPNDPTECFAKKSSDARNGFFFLFGVFAFLGSIFFILGLKSIMKIRNAASQRAAAPSAAKVNIG